MAESNTPLEVRMYSTLFCPYCIRARMLLKKKGVEYKDIRVGSDPVLWDEMFRLSGRNTVPQIFLGDHHVGGYDDLAALNRNDELDKLLGRI